MVKKVSASDAKNNFGGLLEDVAALGRVDILKHGRVVAVVLSPRAYGSLPAAAAGSHEPGSWGQKHMIPPEQARAARIVRDPGGFDEE
jgi:prevent-host-death family protein